MGRAPCCEKVGLKKGRWTAEEDEILIKYIQANGEGSWRSLPKNAGLKRCGKSCRLRWINYLRADLKRGNITAEEEGIIIKLHNSLGNRWSLIAGHLPGRTDNEIKNYWNSHLSRRIDTYRRPCGELPSSTTLMELAAKLSGGCKKKGSGAQRNNPKTTSKTKVPANTKETAISKKPKIADSRRNGTNTSEKSDLTSSEVAELDDQPVSKNKVLQTDLEREESENLTSEFLGHHENTEIFMLSPNEATEIFRTGAVHDEEGGEEEELEIDEFFFDDVMSDNLQSPDVILGSNQEIRDGVMDINDNNQHCDQEILLLNMDSPSFKESKSDDRENGVLSSSLNGENGSTHFYCSPPPITSCFEEDDWGKWDWDCSLACLKDWAVGEAENLELLSCLWDIRDHSSETQMAEY